MKQVRKLCILNTREREGLLSMRATTVLALVSFRAFAFSVWSLIVVSPMHTAVHDTQQDSRS